VSGFLLIPVTEAEHWAEHVTKGFPPDAEGIVADLLGLSVVDPACISINVVGAALEAARVVEVAPDAFRRTGPGTVVNVQELKP
jgi:hypothetical protein